MIHINSIVRLKAKGLLTGNTVRLFFISAVSFILRWGYAFINVTGFLHFLRSNIFSDLLQRFNSLAVYALTGIIYSVSLYFMISTVSSIRAGERFIYYTRAEGGKGRFCLLFKFIGIKKSLRSLMLYISVNVLKLLWFIYLALPLLICGACIIYLYAFGNLSVSVLTILLTGESLLLAVSIVMWRVCTLRYDATVYYACLSNIPIRKAIKKSIRHTDGALSEGVVMEYSLLGWLLSCILIIPAVYCIPYIKLCKSTFVTEAVSRRASKTSTYAVNYLHLSGQHINERC